MRRVGFFLGFVAALLTATGARADATKVRVAIPVNALFFMPLFVAADEGIFKAHDLDVEIISTNGDGPDIDALIADSVQFAVSTPNRLLTAYQQGKPLLAVMNVVDRMGIACFMNKAVATRVGLEDAKTLVDKFKKLKGLTIAATRPGAFTYLLAVDYLKRAGLIPQKDAKIISVGGGPAMIAAVENDEADMGCFGSPIIELAVKRGKSVWFVNNTRGEDPQYNEFLFELLYVRPDYAKQNPDLVRKMAASLLEANRWIAHATQEQLLAVAKKRFAAVDDATLWTAIENVRPAYSQTGVITENAVQAAVDFLKATDMLSGDIPWTAVSDNSFLPK
ncbi:MAG: ABC transporter substrate-binding protein [Xanthobacteraceae bacterium]